MTQAITPSNGHSSRLLPVWLARYQREWLSGDVVAGLITSAVVIPQAMAYASIAGLPVHVGLYTALAPMILYSLFGTSRLLSVSSSSTISILVAAALGRVARSGGDTSALTACATLALLTGTFLLAAWALRLGFVASFISEPVLIGFKGGIGLVIVLDQIPKILGVHYPKEGFFHNLEALIDALPHTVLPTLLLGAATLSLLILLKRYAPKLPAPLFAVVMGIAAVAMLNLGALGVETVGTIPRGLPSLTVPDLSLVKQLWPAALGIALMSFTESIAAARAFASSGDAPLRPNRELLATGVANVGGALVGAMPAGGAPRRPSSTSEPALIRNWHRSSRRVWRC